jgi:hypothetical protein
MKKIAILAAITLFVLLLTKIANQMPGDEPAGANFTLRAERVVQCSPGEITLVDSNQTATHLKKDASWPECSAFHADDVLDFYLSQGNQTKFLSYEKSAWWRSAM